MKTTISRFNWLTRFFPLAFVALLFNFLGGGVSAQIAIDHLDRLPQVQEGKTYFVLIELKSDISKQYQRAFKEHWKLTPYEIIKESEFNDVTDPNASFLFLHHQESEPEPGRRHYELQQWVFGVRDSVQSAKNSKRRKRAEEEKDIMTAAFHKLATVPLIMLFGPSDGGWYSECRDKGEFTDLVVRNYNFGPGFFAAYVKLMQLELNRGETYGFGWKSREFNNPEELKKLRGETLYVAKYMLRRVRVVTSNEQRPNHTYKKNSHVFKHYPYRYQVVPPEVIGNLDRPNRPEKLNYVLLHYRGAFNSVHILNMNTGEIIYAHGTSDGGGADFDDKDMKAIAKAIEEAAAK